MSLCCRINHAGRVSEIFPLRVLNFADRLGIQKRFFHFFRGGINRLKTDQQVRGFFKYIDLRMNDIQFVVKFRRLSENQVVFVGIELIGQVFKPFKPH